MSSGVILLQRPYISFNSPLLLILRWEISAAAVALFFMSCYFLSRHMFSHCLLHVHNLYTKYLPVLSYQSQVMKQFRVITGVVSAIVCFEDSSMISACHYNMHCVIPVTFFQKATSLVYMPYTCT